MTLDITVDANVNDKATPTIADRLPLIDAATNPDSLKEVTLENLLKIINGLTADTTPAAGDSIAAYDTSASAARQVLLSNLHKALTQATAAQAGTIELATNAEVLTGTDTTRAVTPDDLASVGALTGWIPGTGTWSYFSADSPTFVISINADVTALIGVGDRIKLTQTSAKYFIVTAVGAFGGGVTLVTVYGGTDYTLANAAITLPYYSHVKSPFGFPLSPAKWTVEVSDTTQRTQASPVSGTWYNLGSISISIPIGIWEVSYNVGIQSNGSISAINVFSALSTANNSASDADFVGTTEITATGATAVGIFSQVYKDKPLTLAAKTTYYINTKTGVASVSNIYNRNEASKLFIRAKCAYL